MGGAGPGNGGARIQDLSLSLPATPWMRMLQRLMQGTTHHVQHGLKMRVERIDARFRSAPSRHLRRFDGAQFSLGRRAGSTADPRWISEAGARSICGRCGGSSCVGRQQRRESAAHLVRAGPGRPNRPERSRAMARGASPIFEANLPIVDTESLRHRRTARIHMAEACVTAGQNPGHGGALRCAENLRAEGSSLLNIS